MTKSNFNFEYFSVLSRDNHDRIITDVIRVENSDRYRLLLSSTQNYRDKNKYDECRALIFDCDNNIYRAIKFAENVAIAKSRFIEELLTMSLEEIISLPVNGSSTKKISDLYQSVICDDSDNIELKIIKIYIELLLH